MSVKRAAMEKIGNSVGAENSKMQHEHGKPNAARAAMSG